MKGIKVYFKWGLTIFLTACAMLVFFDVFYKEIFGNTYPKKYIFHQYFLFWNTVDLCIYCVGGCQNL